MDYFLFDILIDKNHFILVYDIKFNEQTHFHKLVDPTISWAKVGVSKRIMKLLYVSLWK